MKNNRRDFLKMVAAGVTSAALPGYAQQQSKRKDQPRLAGLYLH